MPVSVNPNNSPVLLSRHKRDFGITAAIIAAVAASAAAATAAAIALTTSVTNGHSPETIDDRMHPITFWTLHNLHDL